MHILTDAFCYLVVTRRPRVLLLFSKFAISLFGSGFRALQTGLLLRRRAYDIGNGKNEIGIHIHKMII